MCLGTLLVLVLLFGCLLCMLVYLVLVACASLVVLLVGVTVVLGLGGLLVWLGVIAALCLSCFGVFDSGDLRCLVGLIMLVVGFGAVCFGWFDVVVYCLACLFVLLVSLCGC